MDESIPIRCIYKINTVNFHFMLSLISLSKNYVQKTVVKSTSRLVRGLCTLSGQLLNQKHEQRTNLWLIAVEKCLVANFPFKTHILNIQKNAKNT